MDRFKPAALVGLHWGAKVSTVATAWWPTRYTGGMTTSSRRRLVDPDVSPLAVADVDLDSGTTMPRVPLDGYRSPPRGVYALVWYHDEPVGALTEYGDPRAVLDGLAERAVAQLEQPLLEHAIRDVLATQHGTAALTERETPWHPIPAPTDTTRVTVAVCTRDRPQELRRCLSALRNLVAPPAEVLVVDNGSADGGARQVVEEFPLVRYVPEPRRGLSWARNRALLEARTPVVAFTDDDVQAHPRWVEAMLQTFEDEPSAVAVTGLVVPAELATPAQVLSEVQGGLGRGYRRRWFSSAVELGESAPQRWAASGPGGVGANMSVLREPILALGGFDTGLGAGSPAMGAEDLDLFFRIVASGRVLVYNPAAVVRHRHRESMERLAEQRRSDATGICSFMLRAIREYDGPNRRAIMMLGLRYLARRARQHYRSLRHPRYAPAWLTSEETGAAIRACLRRIDNAAEAYACHQALQHPDEPRIGLPLIPQTDRGKAGSPTKGITLTIDLDHLDDQATQLGRLLGGRTSAVRVQVRQDSIGLRQFTMQVGSDRISAERLRWAVAQELVRSVTPAFRLVAWR